MRLCHGMLHFVPAEHFDSRFLFCFPQHLWATQLLTHALAEVSRSKSVPSVAYQGLTR